MFYQVINWNIAPMRKLLIGSNWKNEKKRRVLFDQAVERREKS